MYVFLDHFLLFLIWLEADLFQMIQVMVTEEIVFLCSTEVHKLLLSGVVPEMDLIFYP